MSEARFAPYWRCLQEAEEGVTPKAVVADYVLVKLAARCNIACSYCYWFRDDAVYEAPKVLTPAAEAAFVEKLRRHVATHAVPSFFILFHGGEPLLFGQQRFEALCRRLRSLEGELGFALKLAVTTNGLPIDEGWVRLLREQRVGVTLSVDGPREVHDRRRVDFQGRGTYDRVLAAAELLRRNGTEPGFLAVCDPRSDAGEVCRFLADEMGAREFDVLVPDATHDDRPASIAAYYRRLFDVWYDEYLDRGVRIRFLETLVTGLLGGESHVESIGFGPNTTFTLLTDGSLEPLDVLRTAGDGFTRTAFNVFEHELQDVKRDPLWREVLRSSLYLPETCRGCDYHRVCGGGHIGTRWSRERRFDNPSVYCEDIQEILAHVWSRMLADIELAVDRRHELPLAELLSAREVGVPARAARRAAES
jgi:uncharacterized protein